MIRAFLFTLMLAGPAAALDLSLPNGVQVKVEIEDAGSVRLPQAPWVLGQPVPLAEGAIRRRVLTIAESNLTTLQLIVPLRAALLEQGYTQTFTCADASCGGFDFRFQLDLLPAPDMYVDLGDYRYLLMEQPGANPHSVAVLVSRSLSDGFAHITEVSAAEFPEPVEETQTPVLEAPNDIIASLTENGHAVLSDLEFEVGATSLGVGPFPSLEALSAWLETNPSARIVLVGHTDAVGSLEANTSLSQRRAAAVASRLTDSFGVTPTQMQAVGAGYLAPLASNQTEDGRAVNRRVEVVLLSVDE